MFQQQSGEGLIEMLGAINVFLGVIVLGALLTTVVRAVSVRSSTLVARSGSHDGVLFVVSPRRWQRVVLRTVGIVLVVVAGFTMLANMTSPSGSEGAGANIAGAAICLFGVFLIWGAHYWARKRLEVAPDVIWAYGLGRHPRRVPLSDVTRLTPIPSNNFGSYGGVIARGGKRRLFSAPRTMLGYTELIEYLQTHRPDLSIPKDAVPY